MGILLYVLGATFVVRLVYEILRRALGERSRSILEELSEKDEEDGDSW